MLCGGKKQGVKLLLLTSFFHLQSIYIVSELHLHSICANLRSICGPDSPYTNSTLK